MGDHLLNTRCLALCTLLALTTACERTQHGQQHAPQSGSSSKAKESAAPKVHSEPGIVWVEHPLVDAFLAQTIECPTLYSKNGPINTKVSVKENMGYESAVVGANGLAWRVYAENINGSPAVVADLEMKAANILINRRFIYAPVLNGASFSLAAAYQKKADGSWSPFSGRGNPQSSLSESWVFACGVKRQANQTLERQATPGPGQVENSEKVAGRSGPVGAAETVAVTTIFAGAGCAPSPTSTVKVSYILTLDDGSTVEHMENGTSRLANHQLRGWATALQQMREGGQYKVRIPASLAFDTTGSPPRIPPNAALNYRVTLNQVTTAPICQ